MLKRFIRKLLNKRNNLIKEIIKLPVENHFIDSYGNEHEVLNGLKDLLKPGWEKNLSREFTFHIPGRKESGIRLKSSSEKLRDMSNQLKAHGFSLHEKRVLEIGCYGGTMSMLMARNYNTLNTAIDLPQYYINQRNEVIDTSHIDEQSDYLNKLRNAFLGAAGLDSNAVEFVDDDITDSNLDSHSFDFIFSFETLEHVLKPDRMFTEMHRLLRPGGYMYHHYNPFFSLTGGHSLGTTDILWGHALLDENDISRYFKEFRPDQRDTAVRFLNNNLNRMSMFDLEEFTADRFRLINLNKFSDYDYSQIITDKMPDLLKHSYHNACKTDMTADSISIIMKKTC